MYIDIYVYIHINHIHIHFYILIWIPEMSGIRNIQAAQFRNSARLWYTRVSRVDFMSSPAPHLAPKAAGAALDFLFSGCWKDWEGGKHDRSRHSFNTFNYWSTVAAARLLCCGKQTKTIQNHVWRKKRQMAACIWPLGLNQ